MLAHALYAVGVGASGLIVFGAGLDMFKESNPLRGVDRVISHIYPVFFTLAGITLVAMAVISLL